MNCVPHAIRIDDNTCLKIRSKLRYHPAHLNVIECLRCLVLQDIDAHAPRILITKLHHQSDMTGVASLHTNHVVDDMALSL